MSGYKQLLDAYSENHIALVEVRKSIRDAVVGVRQALYGLLGLDDKTEIVTLKSEDGMDVFVALMLLEHRDTLAVHVDITLEGALNAPTMNWTTLLKFNVRGGHVNVMIPTTSQVQIISKPDDCNLVAQAIFQNALMKLAEI